MKLKEESKNVGLKLNIQKLRSWHLVPSLHANRWGNKTVTDFIFWCPQSLQMVTAAIKLKDACSLEGKL